MSGYVRAPMAGFGNRCFNLGRGVLHAVERVLGGRHSARDVDLQEVAPVGQIVTRCLTHGIGTIGDD